MDKFTEAQIYSDEKDNELLEKRINKVTEELESYNQDDGRGFSKLATATKKLNDTAHYDDFESIAKLTEEQGEQLAVLTTQARRLVAENEELRRKMCTTSRPQHDNKLNNEHSNFKSSTATFIKDGKQRLPLDPAMLSEENACLTEQLLLTTSEVEHLKQLLQSRQQTIDNLKEQLLNFVHRHNTQQSQIHQLNKDKSVCEEQLIQKTSNAQLSEESLQMIKIELEGVQVWKMDLEARSKDLTCEMEELQVEVEQLSSKLSATVISLCETKHHLNVKYSEVALLNEKVRTMSNDISAAQVESMQRETLVTCLKSQMEIIKGREAEATQCYELARTEFQENELEADKQKSIISILKEQILTLQTEKKSFVQKKWKECVNTLEDMKLRHEDELKSCKVETRKLHSENSKMSYELKSLVLEKSGTLEKYNQAWRTLKEQKEHNHIHFTEVLQRLTDAEEHWEQEKARRLSTEQQLKYSNNELVKCKDMESTLQDQCLERQKAMEVDFKFLRGKNQDLQHLLKQVTEKNEAAFAALSDAKRESKEQNDHAMLEYNAAVETLKLELQEVKDQATRNAIMLREECRKKQQSLDALQREARNALDCIERNLHEERETSKRLMKGNEELVTRITTLAADGSSSKVILGESKDKIDLLEFELEQANFKLATIARQLSRKIRNHQDHV